MHKNPPQWFEVLSLQGHSLPSGSQLSLASPLQPAAQGTWPGYVSYSKPWLQAWGPPQVALGPC